MKSNNKYNGSNEYQKAIDFLEKGCDCGCSSRIPKEEFSELRESFQALSKTEQNIFLMAQLKAMDGGLTSTSRRLKKKTRSNKRTFYHWDHNTLLCQKKKKKQNQKKEFLPLGSQNTAFPKKKKKTYLNMFGIGRIYFGNHFQIMVFY